MKHKSYILIILLFFSILHSCGLKSYNYPYAENNTTIDTIYDMEVTDEYQWLESDSDVTRDKWLEEQRIFTENYFANVDNQSILNNRINELSNIPRFSIVDLKNDTLYYFKHQMNQDSIRLFKMSGNDTNPICISTSVHKVNSKEQINFASISKNGKYMAIPVEDSDNLKYAIHIYSLHHQDKIFDSIPAIAYNQKPLWSDNGFFFVGSTDKTNENEVYFYDLEKKQYKAIYKGNGILVNTINICLNDDENKLLIAELSQLENKLMVNSYDLNKAFAPITQEGELFIKNRDLKVLGYDNNNIFICRPLKNHVELIAYNLNEKKWHKIYETSHTLSSLKYLKNQIIITYKNNNHNQGEIIDKETWKTYNINLPKDGFTEIITDKENSTIYILNESLIQPQVLYKTSLEQPTDYTLVQTIDNLSFNPQDFIIEDIIVKDKHGNNMDIVLTYKKGLKKDGKNPLLYFDFSNGMNLFADKFFYTRIIPIEQGFIFAHKRFDSPNSSLLLDSKSDEITSILDYLIENGYTNKNSIVLSGREYGATTIAHLINKKPDICKVALLNRGVYDLIRHRKLDENLLPIDSTYQINDKNNFQHSLQVSPFHNVKEHSTYPAMILCTGMNDVGISPVHTYKYIAKLQMHTLGANPLVILAKDQSTVERSNKFSIYNDELLLNYLFLFNNINLEYSEDNFSRILD